MTYLSKMRRDPVDTYQMYNIIRFVNNILLSILLVKFGYDQQSISHFEMYLFLLAAINGIWSYGLKSAFLSKIESNSSREITNFFTKLWSLFNVMGVLSGVFYWMWSDTIHTVLTGGYTFSMGLVFGLILIFSGPIILIEHYYLIQENAGQLWGYTIVSTVLFWICLVPGLAVLPSVETLVYGYCIWLGLRYAWSMYLFSFPPWVSHLKWGFTFLGFSFPLILNGVLGTVMDTIDGALVNQYFDDDYFALFRYGAREIPLSQMALAGLGAAMVPFVKQDLTNISILKSKTLYWMHVFFPLSIFLMWTSPYVYRIVYDASFVPSAYIFNTYLLLLMSRVLLPHTIQIAKHQHKIIVFSTVIEIGINIGLSIWWVQIWQINGLILATVCAHLAQKVILIVHNYIINGLKPTRYIPLGWYGFYICALLLSFIISQN